MNQPNGKDSARTLLAVLTAAGSGTRLGCAGPKALVSLAGRPLVVHAACGLAGAGVDTIVVTAPAESLNEFTSLFPNGQCPGYDGVEVHVVAGSADSRQASVLKGLEALVNLHETEGLEDTFVLVHDAARPLTPSAMTQRVVAALRDGAEAVIPALPVADTLKHVDTPLGSAEKTSVVVGTPERSRVVAVQTPQGFDGPLLLGVHRSALSRGSHEATAATDDAGLVEAAGRRVHVVRGDELALKVTTPLDLRIADILACTTPLAGRHGAE